MNKKRLFSALALSALLGTALAMPASASAHEGVVKKTVTVVHGGEYRGDRHRGKVERYQPVSRGWSTQNHGHSHPKYRGKGHKYGHRKHRYERHEHYGRHEHRGHRDHYPVRQPRHERRDSGVRVHIGYDLVL
ncbi:MAG TPA: hypothetical protein VIQ22_00895 [Gammaproteobacteria bacterium]